MKQIMHERSMLHGVLNSKWQQSWCVIDDDRKLMLQSREYWQYI